MSETYDSSFIVDSLREYIGGKESGAFDGFEITFPTGMNTLDPLVMIKYGTVEATFDEQVLLTKQSIAGKPVKISLFGEEIGSFQLSDVSHGFTGFPVFEQYPIALAMLIRTCFVSVLKNLLPPLSASQLATMKRIKEQREASYLAREKELAEQSKNT